jgi:hypothetical protein
MPNAKDLSLKTRRLKILVIGQQKTGKTNLIGTYPGSVYVFDADDGIITLRGKENVYYDTYADDPKKPMAYVMMLRQLDKFEASVKAGGKVIYDSPEPVNIDLVALDSSSFFLDAILMNILFGRGTLSKPPSEYTYATEWAPQMHCYMTFVKRMLALPCSVLITCHEKEKESEVYDRQVLPALTGSTAGKIGAAFDVVFRSESKATPRGTEYHLLTQNQGVFTAGTRFRDVFELREKPDLAYLMKKVEDVDSKKEGV